MGLYLFKYNVQLSREVVIEAETEPEAVAIADDYYMQVMEELGTFELTPIQKID